MPSIYREICAARYDVPAEYNNARKGAVREDVRPLTIPESLLRDWAVRLDVEA